MRLTAGGLLSLAAALGIGRFVYTPILPVMMRSLHWSAATGGAVASANYLGYLAGALAAMHPGPARRPRGWLFAALVCSAVTTLGMGASGALPLLLLLRFIGGVASAFVIICASALVLGALQSHPRPRLSALFFSGVGAGVILSAVIVDLLAARRAPWQMLWIGSGAAALLCTAAVLALLGPHGDTIAERARGARAAAHASADAIGAVLPHERSRAGLAPLVVAYGLFGIGYVITATFLVTIVRQGGASQVLGPWIWILVGLTAVPSVPAWLWLAERIGAMAALALACLLEAAGVAASVAHDNAALCAAAVLLGGTYMGITALGLMRGRELAGSRAHQVLGLMTASFAVGQAIGPAVAGTLADRYGGYRIPSLMAAAVLVAAAGLVMVAALMGAAEARRATGAASTTQRREHYR